MRTTALAAATATTRDGTPVPEVTAHPVTTMAGSGDPALTTTCVDLTRALLATTLTTPDGTRPLTPGDLAVVAAHVSQAAAIRALLADLPDVLVDTANQLQGMERPAAVVLHPWPGTATPTPSAPTLGAPASCSPGTAPT